MRWSIERVAQVDSTNRVLLDRARAGAPEGLVLVADHQTAGRGRLGREWHAAPGDALLVSALLRPDLPARALYRVTMAAGLAALAAVEVSGAALKWPNDVLVEDAKLAGILAESVIVGDRVDAVVVGMGLNVRSGALPDGAVALDALGGEADRDVVLDRWLVALGGLLWVDDLLDRYRAASATLGSAVRIELGSEVVTGVATGITEEGHLLVGGREIAVADVVHLRPATG